MSSPLFQSPQSFQSNKPIPDNSINFQPEKIINNQPVVSEQPPVDSKFMTIQQVINLITMRLISVENFVNEFGDKPRQDVPVNMESMPESVNVDYSKIAEICKCLMEEHIAEFDHRYAILAEEISNLKNITLNLQNYTMEVNKVLMEERLSKKVVATDEVKEEEEEVPNIEFQFESEQEAEEPVIQEQQIQEQQIQEQQVEEQDAQEQETEEPAVEEDPFSINIVSKKDKKGNKQSKVENSGDELTL
jgi:hypothetical protein